MDSILVQEVSLSLREIVKRIHLFELMDLDWFPKILRTGMTRYLNCLHTVIGTAEILSTVLEEIVERTGQTHIYDFCSGSGGPIVDAVALLRERKNQNLQLILSDLYPDLDAFEKLKERYDFVSYIPSAQNVCSAYDSQPGICTLISSFHHLYPEEATAVLQNLTSEHHHICIFEISDNAFPIWLWWLAIIPAFVMTFFLTLFIRPIRFTQLFFTYCVPILPFCIAWDGAVSNARTYTKQDLETLIASFPNYHWEILELENKTPSKMLCLVGSPKPIEI